MGAYRAAEGGEGGGRDVAVDGVLAELLSGGGAAAGSSRSSSCSRGGAGVSLARGAGRFGKGARLGGDEGRGTRELAGAVIGSFGFGGFLVVVGGGGGRGGLAGDCRFGFADDLLYL